MPEGIAFLPPDVPTHRAEELNKYLDSILSGNTKNRRKIIFLPSFGAEKQPNLIFPTKAKSCHGCLRLRPWPSTLPLRPHYSELMSGKESEDRLSGAIVAARTIPVHRLGALDDSAVRKTHRRQNPVRNGIDTKGAICLCTRDRPPRFIYDRIVPMSVYHGVLPVVSIGKAVWAPNQRLGIQHMGWRSLEIKPAVHADDIRRAMIESQTLQNSRCSGGTTSKNTS